MTDQLPRATTERALLEVLRKSLAHDLRTPLGTIVNYAAVLEAFDSSQLGDTREVARKIRLNAMRAAAMVQHVANAIALVERAELRDVELVPLLDECAAQVSRGERVEVSRFGGVERAHVQAELLRIAWQATLQLDRELRGRPPERIELETLAAPPGAVRLILWVDGHGSELGERVVLRDLLRGAGERIGIDSRLALDVAYALVDARGGELSLFGRPGGAHAIELRVAEAV